MKQHNGDHNPEIMQKGGLSMMSRYWEVKKKQT